MTCTCADTLCLRFLRSAAEQEPRAWLGSCRVSLQSIPALLAFVGHSAPPAPHKPCPTVPHGLHPTNPVPPGCSHCCCSSASWKCPGCTGQWSRTRMAEVSWLRAEWQLWVLWGCSSHTSQVGEGPWEAGEVKQLCYLAQTIRKHKNIKNLQNHRKCLIIHIAHSTYPRSLFQVS